METGSKYRKDISVHSSKNSTISLDDSVTICKDLKDLYKSTKVANSTAFISLI